MTGSPDEPGIDGGIMKRVLQGRNRQVKEYGDHVLSPFGGRIHRKDYEG